MSSSTSAIPKGSTVLVTGANAYIGSHVIDQFLRLGFKVRGTVRDLTKNAWVAAFFDERYGKAQFELVEVPDLTKEGALEPVIKGVSAIAHVASDVSFNPDPNIVVTSAVENLKNILRTAAAEPSVKRFVLTSSSSAALHPKPNTKFHVDSNTWNHDAVEKAWAPPPYDESRSWSTYEASKTQAEQELHRFAKEEKPGFVVNAVLPNFTVGTVFHESQVRTTSGFIRGTWHSDETAIKYFSTMEPQYFINVVDIALLHVAAVLESDVVDERLFGFAEPWSFNKVMDLYKELDPNKKFPDKVEGMGEDLSTVATERAVELLKRYGRPGFASIKESIKETIPIA